MTTKNRTRLRRVVTYRTNRMMDGAAMDCGHGDGYERAMVEWVRLLAELEAIVEEEIRLAKGGGA